MPKINDSSRGSSDLVASPSDPVVGLPAGSDWNKMDVKMFRLEKDPESFLHSPLCVWLYPGISACDQAGAP